MLASGKEKIFGEGLIVSIFGEKESYALYFIKKQDITAICRVCNIKLSTRSLGGIPLVN